MKCTLEGFKSFKVKDLLPAFDLLENEARTKHFPCCNGDSFRKTDQEDGLINCNLQERIAKLQSLLDCYQDTWHDDFKVTHFGKKEFLHFWNWFSLSTRQKALKGKNFDSAKPRIAWSIAAMGIWRFGMNCFVFSLDKHKIQDFIQYISSFKAQEASPVIFFEVNDCRLSLQKREECAYLISWCEKHMAPLWIINYGSSKSKTKKKTSSLKNKITGNVMAQFENLRQEEEEKPFRESLEADSLSKLLTLTDKLTAKDLD